MWNDYLSGSPKRLTKCAPEHSLRKPQQDKHSFIQSLLPATGALLEGKWQSAFNSEGRVLSEITTNRKKRTQEKKNRAERPGGLRWNIKAKADPADNIGMLRRGHPEYKKALRIKTIWQEEKRNIAVCKIMWRNHPEKQNRKT